VSLTERALEKGDSVEPRNGVGVLLPTAMYFCLLFLGFLLAGVNHPDVTIVRHVRVVGNFRVPSASILRQVSSAPDKPFDPAASQADLRKLYGMGAFQNVEVESRNAGEGYVDVTFRVKEFPFVSAFELDGVKEALAEQIRSFLQKEKLEIRPATPFNPAVANRTALGVRDFMRGRKYPNAEVRIIPESNGPMVRVTLRVIPGPRLEVGKILFRGNESISDSELRKQMQYTRDAPFWARWGGAGRYLPEQLSSDIDRVRHYYESHGFATVAVGRPEVSAEELDRGIRLPLPGISTTNPKVVVRVPIVEGPRYTLSSLKIEGDAKEAAGSVRELTLGIRIPSLYDWSLLEKTRLRIAEGLGHHGYALAQVALERSIDLEHRNVSVTYRITAGYPVLVGRIEFAGNSRLPDKFLRRELKTAEGDVFDSAKLDASVESLNKSNLVKEVSRNDVALHLDEERNKLDIVFKVKEKDRQGIYGTGGTGGIGGGYMGLIYTAFNLLRLGETLSLELDGGAAQSNMLLNIVGTHFLGTPFTIALSGFNRLTNFNIANIVPGPENLIQLLTRRTAGVSLSGAYPITAKLHGGVGFVVARDSITGEDQSGVALPSGPVHRSDLSPFLMYDSTKGMGPQTRGSRVAFSHVFSGTSFLRSMDSTADSLQFAHYVSDPLSHGRNSFAFLFQASTVRPQGSSPLFLDRRLFPGDESVRGFHTGGLSPWAYVPDNSASPLQPAGADTMIGFSSEYRVPIRGALSGVAFMDLGWTHLSRLEASQLGTGASLLDATNGLLRASLGGELRLQLPMIRQPARVIFAWNPLRFTGVFQGPSSRLPLSDPRGVVRFALGSLF
jgi:outer membrane protein assembly complex protein YaeT